MSKTSLSLPITVLLLLAGIFLPLTLSPARAQAPTPTYDPLVEPTMPPNPTELEWGGNLYWHWCMTCHGDIGQGLTDEWRSVWESDHQNCWARGCHAGKPGDTGFPIPTLVPAIAGEGNLSRFDSLPALYSYLRGTHPPQHPGLLEDKEYHAIAVYVFAMNNRAAEENTATPTIPPTLAAASTPRPASPTATPPPASPGQIPSWLFLPISLGALAGLLLLLRLGPRRLKSNRD